MNNTTQLLAVLAEYSYLRNSVYKAIQTIAFIEREWGTCPPITSIRVMDDNDDNWLDVEWKWAGGATYVSWRFFPRSHVIWWSKSIGGIIEKVENPKPPQVAKLLAKHIAHIAEHAWDYTNW